MFCFEVRRNRKPNRNISFIIFFLIPCFPFTQQSFTLVFNVKKANCIRAFICELALFNARRRVIRWLDDGFNLRRQLIMNPQKGLLSDLSYHSRKPIVKIHSHRFQPLRLRNAIKINDTTKMR